MTISTHSCVSLLNKTKLRNANVADTNIAEGPLPDPKHPIHKKKVMQVVLVLYDL